MNSTNNMTGTTMATQNSLCILVMGHYVRFLLKRISVENKIEKKTCKVYFQNMRNRIECILNTKDDDKTCFIRDSIILLMKENIAKRKCN